MQIAVVNRTSRINAGHLWVFSNELAESPKRLAPGSIVELRDRKDGFLGVGYCNPNSLISIRILSREARPIDAAFFRERMEDALVYRRRFTRDTNSFRAVYSEGDRLPGLVIDKYEDCISIQFLTLGMEALSGMVIEAVEAVFAPSCIVLRNDSPIRGLEGLPLEKKVIKGSLERLPVVREGTTIYEVDPLAGHKTGFFLDQSANRRAFSRIVGEGAGLDLFCYTGPWSIKLAQAGATVTGVDSSETAVAQARKNAGLNNLSGKCSFVKSDVFEFVKNEAAAGRKYDYIVLDPPAFVKSKARIKEAVKAYRKINAAAMGLLKPHGLLATASCSHHIDRQTFIEIVSAASRDARKFIRVIEMRGQSPDHPVSLNVPETEYLKCVLMEVN
ncbi:MAG: class I SAM-dependent rRNA methyltransferase [Deltaproteobacteria bacterium]|nr:class I SAM-dependent rRNA methyltransferase [Deltaproteobacteria bacterium]